MNKLLVAGSVLALSTAPALADGHSEKCFDKGTLSYVDCPQPAAAPAPAPIITLPPEYDWGGFYLGAHVGFGGTDIDGVADSSEAPAGAVFLDELDDTGFLVGGQLGWNYELTQRWLVGVELDASYVDIDDEVSSASAFDQEVATLEVNYAASARARLGYMLGPVMPYVSGGVGVVDFEATAFNVSGGGGVLEETVFAPVVGGGLDFLITDNWIAGADFQYFFFDESLDLEPVIDFDAGDNITVEDFWAARLKVSYKF